MSKSQNVFACNVIRTRYHGATEYKGAKIIARTGQPAYDAKSDTQKVMRLTVSFDYSASAFDAHIDAARALASKLGWSGSWIVGDFSASEFVFVRLMPHGDTAFYVASDEA